ncbi:transcription factor HES-2-like [Watersipora subatra]|uniref:transcription factor HES-2-like n=1 Tax=Watersipora subatra TaxID=2589382 RepID=UPI00355B9D21
MKTIGSLEMPKDSNRRILKPIIEKRRRERINSHLEELKNLVCGNTRSKLEKADILELTVNHLRKLIAAQRRSQSTNNNNTAPVAIPPKPIDPTRAGYMPCSQEMQRLMAKNVNENILAAHQRRHQGQPISSPSPGSSCSSLSPTSPEPHFVYFPMLHSNFPFAFPVKGLPSAHPTRNKSDVWRPW